MTRSLRPNVLLKPLPWGRAENNPWFIAARIVVLGALFAAPLAFGAVETWAWSALTAAMSVGLLLWGLGCGFDRQVRIHWTILYVPPLALLVTAVCQWASGSSLDPIATREAVIKGCGYVVIFFLVATLFNAASQKSWHCLGFGVTVYSFAISVFAIIQFFVSPGKIYGFVTPESGGYIFGPYVNHNHYAGLMELLLPLAVAFWFTRPAGTEQRWLAGFGCCVGLLSVVLSGSRAGVVAVALEGAVLAAVITAKSNARRSRCVAVLSFLCALLAAVSAWLMPERVAHRFDDMVSGNASWEIRKRLTGDSFQMMAHYPIAGVGLGAFEAAYPRYQSFPSNLRIDYAHNDVVQLAAETGVAGALCLGVALAALTSVFRALPRKIVTDRQWYGAAAGVAILGVTLHSWFDFNLHIPANAAWLAAITGMALAATCHHHRQANSI